MELGELPHLLDVGDEQHPLQELGVGPPHVHPGPTKSAG